MLSNDLKRIAAENCNEYVDEISMDSNMLVKNSNNCSRCINYKNGQCSKSLFSTIKQIITLC